MTTFITSATQDLLIDFQGSNTSLQIATDTYNNKRAIAFEAVLLNYQTALKSDGNTFKTNADFGTAFTLELLAYFDFESTSDLNFFEVAKMVILNGNYDLTKIAYAEGRTIYNLVNADKYAVYVSNNQLDKARKSDDYIVAIKAIIKTLRLEKNKLILAVNAEITKAYKSKKIADLELAVEVAKVVLSEKKAEAKKAEAEAKKADKKK